MIKAKAAEIHSYKVYLEEFGSHNNLQENYDVVVCDKKLAEQIFEEKLNDKYETNVRCTHCGSTEFLKVYGTDGAGYFDSVDDNGYLNFKEEREGGSLDFMHFICIDCYHAEFRDTEIEK